MDNHTKYIGERIILVEENNLLITSGNFKYNMEKEGDIGEKQISQSKLQVLSSSGENNSVLKLIQKMKLLFYNEGNNLAERVVAVQELVSFLETIFKSPAATVIFSYLLEQGAATSWLLQVETHLPEATVYRGLKRLRAINVVFAATKVRKGKGMRGGPRPTVWCLQGAEPEKVAQAIIKHNRALSPKYRIAEEFIQDILEPYLRKNSHAMGITYLQIISLTRGHTAPFPNRDIAEISATILEDKGIRVWR